VDSVSELRDDAHAEEPGQVVGVIGRFDGHVRERIGLSMLRTSKPDSTT
jgi:hypothetical protein